VWDKRIQCIKKFSLIQKLHYWYQTCLTR